MKQPLLVILIATLLTACESRNISEGQREAVKEAMANRALRKLSDVEILEAAQPLVNGLTDGAQTILSSSLHKAIEERGVEQAIAFCNVNAYPLIDSASKEMNASIRRVSSKIRNPKDEPDANERIILEAYQYAHEQGQPLNDHIQLSQDKRQVIYARPIMISSGLCLSCHGAPDREIQSVVHAKIQSLYPTDSAHGYQLGGFRGMWSVQVPVQEVVSRMD